MESLVTFKILYLQNPNYGFNNIIRCTFLQFFFVDLNKFIQKHDTLQNITLQGLSKNVIPIVLILRSFQYYHHIPKSNTFKIFNINKY
jgi:hypothetical protein